MDAERQKYAAMTQIFGLLSVLYGLYNQYYLYSILYFITCLCSFNYHYSNFITDKFNSNLLRLDLFSQHLSVYSACFYTLFMRGDSILSGASVIAPLAFFTYICDLDDEMECNIALISHVISIIYVGTLASWNMGLYWLITFLLYKLPSKWGISIAHLMVHIGNVLMLGFIPV
jgi:hypothetical protein